MTGRLDQAENKGIAETVPGKGGTERAKLSLRATTCILAITLLSLGVTEVSAQDPTSPDPLEGMPIRLGPVGVSPTLTITNFGIDSNVFNDSVDPQQDFTLTATPKVLARVRAGRAALSGSLATGLVYYQKFEDERAMEYATEGRVDVETGTFRPWFLASRIDTSERLNVEIDLRAPRVQTNLAGGLRVIATPRFGIVAAARRSSLQFEEGSVVDGVPLSQTLNSDAVTLEGGVEYYPTPLTTFSLVASQQQDRFDEAPGRDADSLRIMPSVRMVAPAIVEGSFGVGYRRFDGKSPLLPDFSGVVAQATVSHRFGDVLKLDLNVSRDIQYSFEQTEPYYILSSLRVTVTRQLRESLDIRGSAGRDNLDYHSIAEAVGAPDDTRRDRYTVISGGAGYRFRPDLRTGIDLEYAKRDSDRPDHEYDRTRLVGTMSFGF